MVKKYSKTIAAAKAGMDPKTARKYLKSNKEPSELKKERTWRTRKNPFTEVWPTLSAMLESAPGLEAKTLLEWLISKDTNDPKQFHFGQLRTLQRNVRDWRALNGPDKEVMFPQEIYPGRQSQSDYTCMNKLNIVIAGNYFPHLVFHFMLPYSRWETISICYTESFDSLTTGYSKAVWELGAVAIEHRTDNLTAATHKLDKDRDFNKAWIDFLSHHGVKPSRNNPGQGHENGSVEKSHDLFKKAVEQQLLLRGSRSFESLLEYETFLTQVCDRRNAARKERLSEEINYLLNLPERKWDAPLTLPAKVNRFSTISVLKGTYSVPSRLIGYSVEVDVYHEEIKIRYGKAILESIPRLLNDSGANINYRHIISYLLRKPGAFANYQYREQLFPRPIFRRAYDALVSHSVSRGHKYYLELLQLAAIGSESDVACALDVVIEAGQIPKADNVKALLDIPQRIIPNVRVQPPMLTNYDALISLNSEEVSYVISQ